MEDLKGNLEYIKSMIEHTREITAGSWMFLMVWGVLVIMGVTGMYGLIYLEMYSFVMWNWIAVVVIGVLFSIVYGRKLENRAGVKTYASIAVSHVGVASGVGFVLVGFILPMMHVYSWEQIPVLISVVAGMMLFSMAGIYDWNFLKYSGVSWWIGTLVMGMLAPEYRSLLFIPLIAIGYLLPALRLRSMYYQGRTQHES